MQKQATVLFHVCVLFVCTLGAATTNAQIQIDTSLSKNNNPETRVGHEILTPNQEKWANDYVSWHHWWEANAIDYLQLPESVEYDASWQTQRKEAGKLISKLLHHESPHIIAEAALAAGRINLTSAIDRLEQLTEYLAPNVRRNAYLALGLMNRSPRLIEHTKEFELTASDKAAQIMAITLLEKPNKQDIAFAINFLKDNSPVVHQAAAWFARLVANPQSKNITLKLLSNSSDPYVVNDAIVSYADLGIKSERQVLLNLVRGNDTSKFKIPTIKKLNDLVYAARNAIPRNRTAENKLNSMRLSLKTSAAIGLENRKDNPNRTDTLRTKLRDLYQRRSNLLPYQGFGGRSDRVRTGQSFVGSRPTKSRQYIGGDLLWVYGFDSIDHFTSAGYDRRFLLITLGKIGSSEDAELLQTILDLDAGLSLSTRKVMAHDPNRGFAALALGIYLRRIESGSENIRHSARDKIRITNELLEVIRDHNEPYNLRAACVTAIGISQNKKFIASLKERITIEDNPLVLATIARALAMLGDQQNSTMLAKRIIEKYWPATGNINYLYPSIHTVDPLPRSKDRLNRIQEITIRAAAEALCLSGSELDVESYNRWMGRDAYVDLRLTQAMKIYRKQWQTDEVLRKAIEQYVSRDINRTANRNRSLISPIWMLSERYDPNITPRTTIRFRQSSFMLFNEVKSLESKREHHTFLYANLANPFLHEMLFIKTTESRNRNDEDQAFSKITPAEARERDNFYGRHVSNLWR
ncbi:HEAT repeat domain-containing protein [Poriferisphaera sp. WC338]|uniref:HEAT repeat domain-containing protein n=1 Tax=Poriferisphaera sp. WC338 TaxID=3425129 RepID=UPI003D81994B